MRVSSQQSHQVAIDSMLDQQEKLFKVQRQVATGKRIFKPSEDPVASARIVDLNDLLKTTEQYQDNVEAARSRLTVEESALSGMTGVLQRVRELSISANNASQTNETRRYIAEEVDQLLSEALDLSNSTDSTGNFLFSGSKNKFRPFVQNSAGYFEYHGDETQKSLQIGPKRIMSVSDTGSYVFRAIKDGNGEFAVLEGGVNKGRGIINQGSATGIFDGNTYVIAFERAAGLPGLLGPITYSVSDSNGNEIIPKGTLHSPGVAIEFGGARVAIEDEPKPGDFFVVRPSENKDVFTTIKDLVDALRLARSGEADKARLQNQVNRAIIGFDQELGRILEVRANVGTRLNALDNQENINQDYKIQIKGILSDVQDLDYAEAVSKLNLRLTGLQASQKAFTRVQGISMFDYL